MASLSAEAPDPKIFKSWEDAFKYPVPTVRRLEQQLRGDISRNRERLRTLVGSSYRDLLGTADSIVQMDAQMQEVEIHLSATSRRCNTSLLEKSFANSRRLDTSAKYLKNARFTRASQLAVFRRCPEVLARTLRKGGSVLLAAKVLIISRLLHKQLSGHKDIADYVDNIWARLGRIRQKLLGTVDRRLASSTAEPAKMVDAMCAYSLATSTSSSLEILRHFHHVRLEAISSRLRKGVSDHAAVLEALRLWIRTLQDTRTIFPKQLVTALSKLRAGALTEDEGVRSLEELDFGVHKRWLGEEVVNFVPYVRRDDMTVSDASKQLSSWAPAALQKLLSNLKGCLGAITSLDEVIELRKSCLELLFSHYHIAGVRRDSVLSGFRNAFEERLLEVVKKRCETLSGVGGDVSEILEDWDAHKDQETSENLWDSSTLSAGIAHGAKDFTNTLRVAVNGQTNAIRMVAEHYQSWLANIVEIDKVVSTMKETRWEDHLDDLSDEDDSDDEEEATLSKIKILLKETDPASIQKQLTVELTASFDQFRTNIESIASSLENQDFAQAKSVFLIRVLREVKQNLPKAYEQRSLDFASIDSLHAMISKPAVEVVLEKHNPLIIAALQRKSPAGRAMWDGNPELPVLPSPWTYRLLKDLEQELSRVGTDVWTPKARDQLKMLVRGNLTDILSKAKERCQAARTISSKAKKQTADDGAEKEKQNGEDATDETSGQPNVTGEEAVELPTNDTATQLLFDIDYLDALARDGDNHKDEKLESFCKWLQGKAELDQASVDRIGKAAKAYKIRTKLLFALAN